MADVVVASTGAVSGNYTNYIQKQISGTSDQTGKFFDSRNKTVAWEKAAEKLSIKGKSDKEKNLNSLIISHKKESFLKLGKTQDERIKNFQDSVKESLENLWEKLGVKDVNWVAGVHLNTNMPHAHIIYANEAVDLETGEPKNVPKIPRQWFYRENKNNSVLGEIYSAAHNKRLIAEPPEKMTTILGDPALTFPARELSDNKFEKSLENYSRANKISPDLLESLINNSSVYISQQGALTFVRRDVDGRATSHTYQNGNTPAEDNGFFFIGNPNTAKDFIVTDTPQEALALWQINGHRNLSKACFVAAEKGATPEALKGHLESGTDDRAVKVIWSLGLDENNSQIQGDFEDLQSAVLQARAEDAAIEFATFHPVPGRGKNWTEQMQMDNLGGHIRGIIQTVFDMDEMEIGESNDEEKVNYYNEIFKSFSKFEIENEGNLFTVKSAVEAAGKPVLGQYRVTGELANKFDVVSIGNSPIADLDKPDNLSFETEADALAGIEELYSAQLSDISAAADREISEDFDDTKPEEQGETQFEEPDFKTDNSFADYKAETDYLRAIHLADVLPQLGFYYEFDSERREYNFRDAGRQYKINVKGDLFYDRKKNIPGGRGAIDLVTQVMGVDFHEARQFLKDNFGSRYIEKTEKPTLELKPVPENNLQLFDNDSNDNSGNFDESFRSFKSNAGDEAFTNLSKILKEAGFDGILSENIAAVTFQNTETDAKYKLEINGIIRFTEWKPLKNENGDNTEAVCTRGIKFQKNERTDSFEAIGGRIVKGDHIETAKIEDNRELAGEITDALLNEQLASKLVVEFISHGSDELKFDLAGKNEQKIETILAEQKGKEYIAELQLAEKQFKLSDYLNNLADQKAVISHPTDKTQEPREASWKQLKLELDALSNGDFRAREKAEIPQSVAADKQISLISAKAEVKVQTLHNAKERIEPWREAMKTELSKTGKEKEDAVQTAKEKLAAAQKATAEMTGRLKPEQNPDDIEAKLPAEAVWALQLEAAKRGDAENFAKLERMHGESELPRPDTVFSRLLAVAKVAETEEKAETVQKRRMKLDAAQTDAAQTGAAQTDAAQTGAEDGAKLKIKLRTNNGQLEVVEWRESNSKQPSEKDSDTADKATLMDVLMGRRDDYDNNDAVSHNELIAQKSAEVKELRDEADNQRNQSIKRALDPIRHNFDPFSPIKGKLAPLTKPLETMNARLNPIEKFKNDPSVQVIRAVMNFARHQANAYKLSQEAIAKEIEIGMLKFEQITGDAARAELNGSDAAQAKPNSIADHLKDAVENEKLVRAKAKLDPDTNAEILSDSVQPLYKNGELSRLSEAAKNAGDYETLKTAARTNSIGGTQGVENSGMQAESVIERANSFIQAEKAVTGAETLADGTIEVEFDAVRLYEADRMMRTADTLEYESGASLLDDPLDSFELENFESLDKLFDSIEPAQLYNSPLADLQQSAITSNADFGDDLSQNLMTNAVSPEAQEIINANQRVLDQIKANDQAQTLLDNRYDQMALDTEQAVAEGISFEGVGAPQTVESEEYVLSKNNDNTREFWENRRAELDEQIKADKMKVNEDVQETVTEEAEADIAEQAVKRAVARDLLEDVTGL